jgi:hypothetical protein
MMKEAAVLFDTYSDDCAVPPAVIGDITTEKTAEENAIG